MCGLSPLEAIQWMAGVTASTSIVKMEVETVKAALSLMDGGCILLDSEAQP